MYNIIFHSDTSRSVDFHEQLKTQYKQFIETRIGKGNATRFPIFLDTYESLENNIIYADLITPDNYGHRIEIIWNYSLENIQENNENIFKFTFNNVPFENIFNFLKPSKKLPFKITNYPFKFECFHFHNFKDINFKIFLKGNVNKVNLKEIELIFISIVKKWNEINANNISNLVDYIHEIKKQKKYCEIALDLGSADRKIIELILYTISNNNNHLSITEIIIE